MKSERIEKSKVVIDTNTIISAPLSEDGNPAMIFELLLLGEINNFRSEEITNEVIEVFHREKIKKLVSREKTQFIIGNYKKFSELVKPNIELSVVKEDDDDNRILECAETANVDYVISGDEHLLNLKNHKNIKIVSLKNFYGSIKPQRNE